jgi:hypothetical protein
MIVSNDSGYFRYHIVMFLDGCRGHSSSHVMLAELAQTRIQWLSVTDGIMTFRAATKEN